MAFITSITLAVTLLFLFGLSQARQVSLEPLEARKVSKTIYVNPSGHGDFTTVQHAIDAIPSYNREWINIKLKAGVYNEKVRVAPEKTFILLDGESSNHTIIQWDDTCSGYQNATFAVLAENFVARNIYNKPAGGSSKWAHGNFTWSTALHVGGDKVAFFNCSFIRQQDSLNDAHGRHYFESCYIEGLVDFIWGNGTSIYQIVKYISKQKLTPTNLDSLPLKVGMTHQKRVVSYSIMALSQEMVPVIGRAYKACSRVTFFKTYMSEYVLLEGWRAWDYTGKE